MDRLSPLDASFLSVEDTLTPMHIASVSVCEGPAPDYGDFLDRLAAKLPLIPRYRQKIRFVPFGLTRPVWVDDPHFNLEYHVRHTALPAPGGPDELRSLVGRVMAQHLDRHKPLWEVWMAEGFENGRWAMLIKVHHCMVDGIAGSDLMAVLFDLAPDAPVPGADTWSPAPEPTDAQVFVDALRDVATLPREQLRVARSLIRMQANTFSEVRRGVRSWLRVAERTAPTSLSGPAGPHRRWDYTRVPLSIAKRIAHASGGTVNDVVLAAVTRGFRDILTARGEDLGALEIRSFIPVSLRGADEHDRLDNRVSGMLAILPVAISDPVERLDNVSAQMRSLKESGEALAGELLEELSVFAPPAILALGERAAARLRRLPMTTVTTNVPGPQSPLYACGRRLEELYPYVGLGAGTRINVAVFSYDGHLGFGVTGDWESASDINVLVRGVTAGMDELGGSLLRTHA